MSTLEQLRQRLPEAARDIKVNLQTVLSGGSLSAEQRWGVALAAAIAARHAELTAAVHDEAQRQAGAGVVEDARAAAVLMAMNNVYYRFRHHIERPAYSDKPARLRMQRLAQPQSKKADFELFALAVSAINGCETCVRAHEKVVIDAGLTDEQVHDAVRLAAVIHATAVGLELSTSTAVDQPSPILDA